MFMFKLRVKFFVGTTSPLTKFKKKNRECCNLKARVSVHWQAQCHAKWGCREFQYPAGIKSSSNSHWLTFTNKPQIYINLPGKKNCIQRQMTNGIQRQPELILISKQCLDFLAGGSHFQVNIVIFIFSQPLFHERCQALLYDCKLGFKWLNFFPLAFYHFSPCHDNFSPYHYNFSLSFLSYQLSERVLYSAIQTPFRAVWTLVPQPSHPARQHPTRPTPVWLGEKWSIVGEKKLNNGIQIQWKSQT